MLSLSRRRRLLQALTAASLAPALVAGCRREPAARQILRFWAMGREGEVVTSLLPEFERRNPDIQVQVQQLPWTAAHEKLLTSFAGDALPDLCQLGNTWIPEFAALRALEDLEPRLKAATPREDYFPGILATNVIDGQLLGLPWYVDTRLLYYRKDILARAGWPSPPRSWEEWRQCMAAIQARAGKDQYAILLPLQEFEPLLALALQQGEPVLREGGRYGNFRGREFRRALDFYVEIFRRGWAPSLTEVQISNVWDEFGHGMFAFYISGPWNIAEFKKRLPAERQQDWSTAPLPGPAGPGGSIAGGSSLVLFRSSRHKEAAWRLIEYLSAPEVQVRFHALTGNLPPRRSAWNDAGLAADPYARAFRDQLERARPAPAVPEWERIVNDMQSAAERVVRGAASAEEAMVDLDRKVDAILEKRRWLLSKEARS